MSHPCGYPLGRGRACSHPVQDPQQPDCGRHKATATTVRTNKQGCTLVEDPPGAWRCITHQTEEWETATAMGAILPCRIPGALRKRMTLAEQIPLDPNTAMLLANDSDMNVRRVLAGNRAAPSVVLSRLAQGLMHPNAEGIWRLLVRNPVAPGEALLTLLDGHASNLRFSLVCAQAVRHRNMPERGIRWAAEHTVPVFRVAAAENPNAPTSVLERLATDQIVDVRRRVAANRRTPPNILERLAHESDGEMRMNVARNPSSPAPALVWLFGQHGDTHDMCKTIARNWQAPGALLEALATHASNVVRWGVAENPCAPPRVLAQLASDATEGVRHRVAGHGCTPRSAIEALAQDLDPKVQREAEKELVRRDFAARQSTTGVQ